MNTLEIFERLGLRPGGILIRGFEMADWGRTLVIYADYIGLEEQLPFRLFFQNCAEIHWLANTETVDSGEGADVIAVFFQPKDSVEFLNMATDFFEVTVQYGQLTIARDWLTQS